MLDNGGIGTDVHSSSPTLAPLPPRVEITVERLEGIVWSTLKRYANRDEASKHVPFVTATVEFSGTCPNMKVYNASKYPHSRYPAVESFFASLAQEPMDRDQAQMGSNEVRKIISTTKQDIGGATTTTTTTTTITKIPGSFPMMSYKDGQYLLVAKWRDDSSQEKLVDSITYFTSPQTFEDADSRVGTSLGRGKKANRPHLTFTLPSAAEQQRPPFLASILSPCNQSRGEPPFSHNDNPQTSKKHGKHPKVGLLVTHTHSTDASTICSSNSHILLHQQPTPVRSQKHNSAENKRQTCRPDTPALGSFLDEGGDQLEKFPDITQTVTRQDDAEVAPVIATKKSKELAATAIAAEPSSAIVGQLNTNKAGAFTPLSWVACGTVTPEIVELRVRVMPEDSDDYDEGNASSQNLATLQNLEGVAHLVFLDQIIEEGTTVMDLPLKIAQDPLKAANGRDHTMPLSTTPATGGMQEYVTLGANARLRVRVTILPQGRRQMPIQRSPPSLHDTIHQTHTMKTQSLPEGLPFYSHTFSLKTQVSPIMEKIFQMPYFLGGKGDKIEEKQTPNRRGPFPHEFPAVVPDKENKKVESFLGDWKSYGESWSWLKALSDAMSGRGAYDTSDREKEYRQKTHVQDFYTIPNVPKSSSTITELTPKKVRPTCLSDYNNGLHKTPASIPNKRSTRSSMVMVTDSSSTSKSR